MPNTPEAMQVNAGQFPRNEGNVAAREGGRGDGNSNNIRANSTTTSTPGPSGSAGVYDIANVRLGGLIPNRVHPNTEPLPGGSSNEPDQVNGKTERPPSILTTYDPDTNSLSILPSSLPLCFGDRYVLTNEIEATNLYRCIDTEMGHEYCAKVGFRLVDSRQKN